MSMIKITLKNGAVREAEKGASLQQVAEGISRNLGKTALAAKVDGQVVDLHTKVERDCSVEFLTFEDAEGREALRHSSSHIMAQAVKRLYGDVKLGIGPAIANGFYYDIDTPHTFVPEDLAKIQAEMEKIVKEDLPIVRREVSREEALDLFGAAGETYKQELIRDLPADVAISLYQQGEFVDLCAGPHVPSTGRVKAIRLQSLAGAYWRGDQKNKMLQRIYGTAFEKKAEAAWSSTRTRWRRRPSAITASWAASWTFSAFRTRARGFRSSIRRGWLSATNWKRSGAGCM